MFVIFWYQLLNGWSGSVMIGKIYLLDLFHNYLIHK